MPVCAALLCLVLAGSICGAGQDALDNLKTESNPSRRADMGLALADAQFDSARTAFNKQDYQTGNTCLDIMTKALDDVVSSLHQAGKSRLYKRAEIRVSQLQRRLRDLTDDIGAEDRGWAEQTGRHLSEIHEKLLEGVMRK